MDVSELESGVLKQLARVGALQSVEEIASALSAHPDSVRRAIEQLKEREWASTSSRESAHYRYSKKGQLVQKEGLPEVRLLHELHDGPKALSSLPPELAGPGLVFSRKNGWVEISAGQAVLTEAGKIKATNLAPGPLPDEKELNLERWASLAADLVSRGLAEKKSSSLMQVSITDAGREALPNLSAAPSSSDSIGALDRPTLLSGAWRNKPLRRYDLAAPTEAALAARRHPISRLRERIRAIFLSMGFEEMEGPLAESAFWNFDALFQPQDHPARDLADTFYLPEKSALPNRALVEDVRLAHEKGWKYSWQEGPARQSVLRTHTTAVSARTLFETADDARPRKFFSVDKVFRNEATDYKHLAEFYQVEGIIVHPGATLGHLLGTLKAFYSKLGFEKIRFRPSFFPYTEPSLEIEVYHPKRETWLELGGAGVFRPEVCGPLGKRYPVLAWGLSLERPLMLANQIEDIRTLYRNDLDWLRHFPVE